MPRFVTLARGLRELLGLEYGLLVLGKTSASSSADSEAFEHPEEEEVTSIAGGAPIASISALNKLRGDMASAAALIGP